MILAWFWLALFEAGARLTHWIPWALKAPLARLIARAIFIASPRLRRATTGNMAVMFSASRDDPHVRRAALRSIENFLLQTLNMGEAYLQSPNDLRRQVSFWSPLMRDRATSLLKQGRVIFATCHYGTWDSAASWATSISDLHVVQQHFDSPGLNEVFRRLREHLGMKSLDMESDVREMFRVLRRKGNLAIVIDRPMADGGEPVEWFDRTTRIPSGVAKLALRTGAVIAPTVVYRNSSGRAILRIAEPIHPDRSREPDDEIARLMQSTCASLERLIRPAPDQWYQFRPLWPPQGSTP